MLDFQLILSPYLGKKAKEYAIAKGMWYRGPEPIAKGQFRFLINGRDNLEKMMTFLEKYADNEKSIEGQIRIVDEDGRRLCHLQEKYLRDRFIVQTSF